jgi:aminobenzoyl-glutamate utilization protein B
MGKKAMTTAAKVLAASALDLFCQPELLDNARQELAEKLAGKTHQTLMPEDVKPPN